MKQVVYLASADADLFDITTNIALDNEDAARRMLSRIRDSLRRLADFPLSAPARPEIAPDARGLSVGKYIALYRITAEDVQIVRVVHGARDLRDLPFPER